MYSSTRSDRYRGTLRFVHCDLASISLLSQLVTVEGLRAVVHALRVYVSVYAS